MRQRLRLIAVAAVTLLLGAAPAVAAPGDLDPSFSGDGFDIRDVVDQDGGTDVAVQPDGKIVVVGTTSSGGATRMSAIRYLPNGELDPQFGSGGKAEVEFSYMSTRFSGSANAVALQPDGRIVMVGTTGMAAGGTGFDSNGSNFALARLKADGTIDASFNAAGPGGNSAGRLIVDMSGFVDRGQDVALAPDGSIFVVGYGPATADANFWTLKVTPTGTVDGSFGAAGKSNAGFDVNSNDAAAGLALQSDGRIVLVGQTTPSGTSDSRWAIARLKTDGLFDPSFEGDGKRVIDFPGGTEGAADVVVDAEGRIVVAGSTRLDSNRDFSVVRLTPAAGADDPSFGSGGRLTIDSGRNEVGRGMALAPNGEIVVTGETFVTGQPSDVEVARVLPQGAPDPSFGQAGVATVQDLGGSEFPNAAAVEPGGKIVVAGGFNEVPGDFMTLRLQGVAPAQTEQPPGEGTPGPGPGSAPGPVADTTLPGFASFAVTRTFRAAGNGGSVAPARAPAGAKVSYSLTEPAQVRFTVERPAAGRRVGRNCLKPTRKNRKRKRCTRYVALGGSFTHAGQAGANSFKFTGRLRNRKLKVGRYRLVAVAADASGNKSAAKRANFRIVRR